MDDRNFRQELYTLKERVSQLSPKNRPAARLMASASTHRRAVDDPFTTQLRDIQAHMTSIEESLRNLRTRLQRSSAHEHLQLDNQDFSSQRNHISLPSGPIFWQLFNSLRSDVRTLDTRVAELEQSLSDLEDRVDSLDPNRFTPASSAASSEVDQNQPTNISHAYKSGESHYVPCMQPELFEESSAPQACFPSQQQQPWTPGQPPVYPNILNPHQDCLPYYATYDPWRAQYETSLRSDAMTTSSEMSRLREQNNAIQTRINHIDYQNEDVLEAIRELNQRLSVDPRPQERANVELPARPWPQTYETPEVRFRDREIARLDELLRISHEKLRSSEEASAQKDRHLSALRAERDERDEQRNRISEERTGLLTDQLQRYIAALDTEQAETADLRSQLAQRNEALQGWQNSWNEVSDSYGRAAEQASSYKHAYYDSMVRAESDLQKMSKEHEEEMAKLKEFCEEKDVVIQRQEDVIARGGKLIEQRDGEIEEMSRKLRAAGDDREHARRIQERLSKLIGERDAEIAELKRDIKSNNSEERRTEMTEIRCGRYEPSIASNDADAGSWSGRPGESRDDESTTSKRESGSHHHPPYRQLRRRYPLAQVEELAAGSERQSAYASDSQGPQPWVQVGDSPLQFQKMPSTEHHEHRENDDGQEQEPWAGRSDKQPTHSSTTFPPTKRSKRQRRYAESLPFVPEKQVPEAIRGGHRARLNHETRGSGRFAPSEQGKPAAGDDAATYYPPLPMPVTARRMASDANLHSRGYKQMDASRKLSKHQSMQELPKRRLQAYVESEAESGGEARGGGRPT